MTMMNSIYARSAKLFVLQFCMYFIVTLNIRAVAHLDYVMVFITDVLIATIGFTTIKEVIKAETRTEQICYVLGGAAGAQVALVASFFL
jgi:hypothetical protein